MFAAFDLISLTPLLACVGVAALVFLVADYLRRNSQRAESRLDDIDRSRHPSDQRESSLAKVSTSMVDWLQKKSPQLSQSLQSKNEKNAGLMRERLSFAGFRHETAPAVFMLVKTLSTIAGLLIGGGSLLFALDFTTGSILKAAIIAGAAFFLPDLILYCLTKRRQQQIFLALPDCLDLMVVCVEAGLGLDAAMRKVVDGMKDTYRVVAYEFNVANMQLQMGISRGRVLRELADRNGEEDLKALAGVLIQASRFGSGVGQALRVQSDMMRRRRRQIAEEKAAKTAVKLIFPLVLFIFPGIFVVLVGPAAISMIRNLLPAMEGG